MEVRRKFLFCLRNEVLEHLSDRKSGSGKKRNTKTKPNPSNSFNDWTWKIYDSINVMPMPGLQLSAWAVAVDLGGLDDVTWPSGPTTHSSEITENVGICWISMLSVRGKPCTASRSCSTENSYLDWMIKIN